ncbi:hypothetical protein EVAR_35203_1 [Eumeta japonica]|uniref:Uncharacterized protein n=1 Tax=Eumeta variegata TaxID=151549 RepID=A0A4C1VDK8_EUMVA|nr:hypothetical protein EVAR_35203_1 [Eumeta japonica]
MTPCSQHERPRPHRRRPRRGVGRRPRRRAPRGPAIVKAARGLLLFDHRPPYKMPLKRFSEALRSVGCGNFTSTRRHKTRSPQTAGPLCCARAGAGTFHIATCSTKEFSDRRLRAAPPHAYARMHFTSHEMGTFCSATPDEDRFTAAGIHLAAAPCRLPFVSLGPLDDPGPSAVPLTGDGDNVFVVFVGLCGKLIESRHSSHYKF